MKRSASSSSRKRGASRRLAGGLLASIIATFVAISACSNQGEGERCETDNGNEDCDTSSGLICYPSAQLKNSSSDRCCPADRSKATHPVCKTAADVGVDATTPADTGPAPATDAGSDADAALDLDAGDDADAALDPDAADADAG